MASSVIEPIARVGFAARGAVYVMVGVLAARAAAGLGGRTTDAQGAVRAIGRLDASGLLLVSLAVGLGAYAVWRFAQALEDLDGKGGGMKGLTVRTGYAASGLIHLALAFTAGGFARRSGSMREWVARSLARAVGAVGGGARRGRRRGCRPLPVPQGVDGQLRGSPAHATDVPAALGDGRAASAGSASPPAA